MCQTFDYVSDTAFRVILLHVEKYFEFEFFKLHQSSVDILVSVNMILLRGLALRFICQTRNAKRKK